MKGRPIWEGVRVLLTHTEQEFTSAFTEEFVHILCIDYVIYHELLL